MSKAQSIIKLPAILENSNFKKLYGAGLTSELGSFITDTTLMLFIFTISDQNKSFMGATKAIFLFCFTLGSLAGGPLGVRFNKRNILIASEILRIPLVLSLIFFHNVYYVMFANGLIGLFTGAYNPSRQAIINEIVPTSDIKDANSLFGSTMAVLHLAAPLVGAGMYGFFKGINEVLYFNLCTYALGIFLLSRMKYSHTLINQSSKNKVIANIYTDFVEGFKYVKTRIDLTAMLIFTLIMAFCVGIVIPLLFPFIVDVLHRNEADYGIVLSLFGLGGIIGGVFTSYLNKHFYISRIFLASIIAEIIIIPIWIRSTHFVLNCFVMFVWGILVFTRIPTQMNYISTTVPKEYLTRVYSFLDLMFVIPSILGGIIVALVGSKLSTFDLLNYTSILFIVLIIWRLFSRGTKELLEPK